VRRFKIALLSGKGVGSTEFGAVWFYLDEYYYPVSIVETGNFNRLNSSTTLYYLADGFMTFQDQNKLPNGLKMEAKIAMNNALVFLKIKNL
jgi:hypothetical protein